MGDDYTFVDAGGTLRTARAKEVNSKLHAVQHVATAIPNVVSWQELTIDTTAGTLASFCSGSALPANATHALFRVYAGGGDVMWTDDGTTAPTSTKGFDEPPGEWGEWVSLSNIKLIATATGTKIGVSFRRYDA